MAMRIDCSIILLMRNLRVLFYCLLILCLLGAAYFRCRTADVYARLGNFYYKRNHISQAQGFYEKSFKHGNKNIATREVYVNSIINSPLTIEAQNKLVDIAEGDIQDKAALKAKHFLYDLKREIHNLYPLNYIKQAPLNQKVVRWGTFPITYTFKAGQNIPQYYKDEINKAFSEWEKCGDVMFSEVQSSNANISINFVNNKVSTFEHGKKYVIAYTTPQISANILQSMNIVFYINDPEGNLFSKNQIYNTSLHEIFHALGFMGHSFEKNNVMYLAKDNNTLVNDTRAVLTEADTSTLKLLYKIYPDITNASDVSGKYVPYLILGDDEEVNLSKVKEAKNYIYHAPSLPSGYIDLAESLVAEKKYAAAIKKLEKALSLAETSDMKYIAYYDLAVSYFYMTNMELSLYYIEKASEIKDTEELHFLKAEALLKSDIKAAMQEYIYLISIAPNNPEYTLRLANIQIREKKYLEARKVLKTFLRNNPKYKTDKRFSNYGILIF